MICLGLDTALGACSVAVVDGDRVLARERLLMTAGQAETLAPMTQRVMAEGGIAFAALDRIGVTTGPGTFTGQRIGLSFARGLALALKIPAVGVTTLEALAAAAKARHPGRAVLAAIDARRGEVYAQRFGADGSAEGEAALLDHAAAAALGRGRADLVLTGTASAILATLIGDVTMDGEAQPDAVVIARLASARAAGAGPPSPFYLRAPDAKLPGPLKPLPRASRP